MTDSTVSVAAEWARWGMDPSKRGGYHLLASSEGRISPGNFEEILSRFSPGSLYDLPQVTISYVPGDGNRYLGLAIHEAEASGADRLGRDVMVTRYFCVPYEPAAATAVSYPGLYEALRRIQPPEDNRSVVSAGLAGGPATPPADVKRALPVAGLLLTGNPVCIVGAEATEMAERLAFIDATMSLLPYGLRAEMAASTWTRGTYQRHRFRLFFSEAPRRSAGSALDDHVVRWGTDAMEITAAPSTKFPAEAAAEYVEALRRLGPSGIAELARATQPMQFDEQASSRALNWVSRLEDHRTSADAAGERRPFRLREAPRIRQGWVRRGPRATETKRVAELLLACLQAVDGDTSQVKKHVSQIEEILRAAELPAAEHRQRPPDGFGDSQQLTPDLAPGRQRIALRQFLVRLSLSRVVDYEGYCLIEDILGNHPDGALLTAIDERAADEPVLKLLIADRLGAQSPDAGLRELIGLAADREIRPDHARVICGLLLRNAASAPRGDVRDVLPLLREHGYLAPALSVREPDDLGYQVETLMNLLAAVFPGGLGRASYRDVLTGRGTYAPTAALFLAVVCLTPQNAAAVAASFTASLARFPGLSDHVREALAGKGLEVNTTDEPARPGSTEEPPAGTPAPGIGRGDSPRESRSFVRRILNPNLDFSSDPPEDDYLL